MYCTYTVTILQSVVWSVDEPLEVVVGTFWVARTSKNVKQTAFFSAETVRSRIFVVVSSGSHYYCFSVSLFFKYIQGDSSMYY